ncbi:class A beta-lactamase-related serine hydrolase [Streptomyces sp. NBC_00289]|uniref:serine hydrolase n=1 Tax=Streptomyces sp. NBC_00289 TaxID=2975703 RepID=UPI0032434D93
MPYPLSSQPSPKRVGSHAPGGRRAGFRAALLAGSVATLIATGTVAPAVAATVSARPDTADSDAPRVQPQRKTRVTAAVLDLDLPGREPQVYGDDVPYDTASIIKVDILAATLLQAQDAGRHLSEQERTQAEEMIQHSDNAAANALWRRIGMAPGLEAANKRLGLTSTTGGTGGKWGLTRTTATDQIRLLRAVFDTGWASDAAPAGLSEVSRSYIRTQMAHIAVEQAWGVSAASDSGSALKNGWLQRTTTGLWDINSVGRITAGGRHYLVAVLSDGSTSMQGGIALVERAARAAVSSSESAH